MWCELPLLLPTLFLLMQLYLYCSCCRGVHWVSYTGYISCICSLLGRQALPGSLCLLALRQLIRFMHNTSFVAVTRVGP
jgi:hypothetical protein